MSYLDVKDLHVRYGGAVAVRGIDLAVDRGEILVVLGPNGAGKTSTLKAIAGQLRQAAGRICCDDVNISHWPAFRVARHGLVMVPEGRRVFAPLTIHENLMLGGYVNRSKPRRDQILAQVYEMFPILDERKRSAAGLLSGGEQQMLAFGRAMMADPAVILMDEPSMGLSPVMVDQIIDSIGAIAKADIGVVMVEQNAIAALDVADRVMVLELGRMVLNGTANEVKHHPEVLRAFLGSSA